MSMGRYGYELSQYRYRMEIKMEIPILYNNKSFRMLATSKEHDKQHVFVLLHTTESGTKTNIYPKCTPGNKVLYTRYDSAKTGF